MSPIYCLLGVFFIALLAILIGAGLQYGYTKHQKNKLMSQKRKKYELAKLTTSSALIDITNRLY